jgi:CRP-like cAMP-binding protein
MEKLNPMRFDPYQLVWEKGQKPKDVYLILDGLITNEETERVLKTGMMFGTDEILFKQDREARMRAEIESFTMRLTKEDFENMMEEYPELKS